jgi:hypothetical protein
MKTAAYLSFVSLLTDGNALLFYKTITAVKINSCGVIIHLLHRLKKVDLSSNQLVNNFMKKNLMFLYFLTPFLVLSQSNRTIIQHYLSNQVQNEYFE